MNPLSWLRIDVKRRAIHVFVLTLDPQNAECNFERNDFCDWSNIALPPENKNKWNVGFNYNVPVIRPRVIANNNLSGGKFAFAQFYNPSGSATLISPNIACFNSSLQLSLQFYLVGDAKLYTCRKIVSTLTRRAKFADCQAVVSNGSGDWTSHSLTFSPVRDPYQVIIRAYGSLLTDVAAIDDITIKCADDERFRRDTLTPLQVITYENWARLREENPSLASEVHYGKPSVMLVVSDHIEASSETIELSTTTTTSTPATTMTTTTTIPLTTTTETTTTSVPTTTLTECNDDFCVEKESSEEVADPPRKKPDLAKSTDEKNITAPDPKEALSNLAQWVQIIRNVAPVLPMIPSLINSFKNGDAPTSTATNLDTPLESTMGEPIAAPESVFQLKKGDTRYHPSEQHVLPITPIKVHHLGSKTLKTAPLRPSQISSMERMSPPDVTHSPYEAPLYPENEFRSDLNLSSLTMTELKTLESIHKKIFPSAESRERLVEIEVTTRKPHRFGESKRRIPVEPSTVSPSIQKTAISSVKDMDRPKQQKSKPVELSIGADSLLNLTPQMIQEIQMITRLPYFEELTEGLDLSLFSKPGGFSVLRKQVVERLIARGLYNAADLNKTH
uniref:MAM domain-containing protein n=1 Tax=Panagrellus redivivus TaxID=6233 RepID=A0A7E4V8M4_PANRE